MIADHNEVVFESEICGYLADHGWLYSANDAGYDRERALFPTDLFAWLEETQRAAYEKALKAAGSEAKFLDVLTTALDKPACSPIVAPPAADAVTPMPGLVVPFTLFTLLYCFLGAVVAWLLYRQIIRSPHA